VALAASIRRRPAVGAALVYAVLAIVMVGPGLVPGHTLSASDYLWSAAPWSASTPAGVRPGGANGELADSVAAFQPFTQYARARLPHAPLWNPYVMAGRPFLADAQSAVFSPFSLPAYVLPFWWSLAVTAALKLFCAALGTYLLGRALGMRFAGALLAGLAFGLGLYMVAWLSWPLSSVWAFLPWLLLACDRVVRRPDAAGVAALAVVVALQFLGGHPESSFHVMVVAVLFAILRLSRVAPRGRPAGAVVLGMAAGGALAAIMLAPFLELLLHSNDVAERARHETLHLPAKYVLALALPEYWGRPTTVATEPFINGRAIYVGALPLLLAGLALLRPSRERVAIAAGGAAALAVALGIQPVFAIVTALPGFAQSGNTRLAVIPTLAVALLAGFGLDDLLARPLAGWRARALPAALAATVALPLLVVLARSPVHARFIGDALGVAWAFATPPATPDSLSIIPMAAALVWIVIGGAAALLIWLAHRGRIAPGTVAALAITLTALDLLRFGMGQNPAIPLDHARQPVTGAIHHLREAGLGRFAGVVPNFGIVALPADAGMRYGLYDARGYDYPVERRYDKLWRTAIAPRVPFLPPTTLAATNARALRALSLLGVTDLIQQPGDKPLHRPGVQLAYDGRDARVYRNEGALPRAWVVGAQRVVGSDREALDAVLSPRFDPRTTAVVQRPIAGLAGGGSARIERYEPERVRIAARTTRRALVILSDVWYPGWQAKVDGRPASIERVDYLLRGVAVGPGTHRIEFAYRPASWRIGWVLTLLTALALAGAVVLRRRRR
jgi:Bacterial membrane protein YfhO